MFKRAIITLLALRLALALNAQTVTWQKAIGSAEGINSVEPTSDGGYILGGYFLSGNQGQQYQLTKIDAGGDTSWTYQYGGTGDDFGQRAHQTSDGGYIIIGKSDSYNNSTEVLLMKTDSAGILQWSKTYGNLMAYDDCNMVQETFDNGFIFGSTYGRVVKTNSVGDTAWTRNFQIEIFYVIQTADSGYAMVGNGTGAGMSDCAILKTDVNGNIEWNRTYGGTGLEQANALEQTADGGYIIAGFTNSFGQGNDDAYAVRINSIGDTLWTRTFGGPAVDRFYHVCETSVGGFVFTGNSSSFGLGPEVITISTTSNGNILWSRCYGGGGGLGSISTYITTGTDGGYVIAGATYNFNAGTPAGYVIHLDENGTSNCNEYAPTVVTGYPMSIVSDPADNFSWDTLHVASQAVSQSLLPHFFNTLCTTLEIADNSGEAFSIAPNPSAGIFSLQFSDPEPVSISVYDNTGKLIYCNEYYSKGQEIDLSGSGPGLYSIQLRTVLTSTVQTILLL